VIPYGKGHSISVPWNTSINGYTVPLPLPFKYLIFVVDVITASGITTANHRRSFCNLLGDCLRNEYTVASDVRGSLMARPHWRQFIAGDGHKLSPLPERRRRVGRQLVARPATFCRQCGRDLSVSYSR